MYPFIWSIYIKILLCKTRHAYISSSTKPIVYQILHVLFSFIYISFCLFCNRSLIWLQVCAYEVKPAGCNWKPRESSCFKAQLHYSSQSKCLHHVVKTSLKETYTCTGTHPSKSIKLKKNLIWAELEGTFQ